MRTVILILIGLTYAIALLLLSRKSKSAPKSALALFFVTWAAICIWNLSVGLSHGYTFVEELPFLIANFVVPAAFAWFMRNRLGRL